MHVAILFLIDDTQSYPYYDDNILQYKGVGHLIVVQQVEIINKT